MSDLTPARFDDLVLLDGTVVSVGVIEHRFKGWTGEPPPRSYGAKPVVELNASGLFAEIAIVRLFEAKGWNARWASTYGGFRYFDDQPLADRSNATTVPAHVDAVVSSIAEANGQIAGTFDVIAWRDDQFRFVEAKRVGKDAIRDTQRRWLAAALSLGYPVDAFALFEWRIEE